MASGSGSRQKKDSEVREMATDVHTVRSFFTKITIVKLILALFTLILSIISSPKTQTLFSGYAILLIIILLLGYFRVNGSSELKQVGEKAVQTLWLSTSLGLVALTMPPAPYFELSQFAIATFMVIGAIFLLLGTYSLMKIRKFTGVYLSI